MIGLRAGTASATIDSEGAQWRAWSIGPHDFLWRGDPAVWAQSAPILFPVVGWTRDGTVRRGGRRFPLGLHGFASTRHFAEVSRGDTHVCLRDISDSATRALYPFDYRLDITFTLEDDAIACEASIANLGFETMPYAFGLHPGFRWPTAAGARIVFDEAERPDIPVITKDGLFSSQRRTVPLDGKALPLSGDLMSREALCFLDARSRGLVFERGDGVRLRVEMQDFPHLALWSRPPAQFLCIESWTGYGDPDGFDGELADKPSIRLLAPGATARHAARYTVLQAP
jgi:galactose mutarotase-like enzyme